MKTPAPVSPGRELQEAFTSSGEQRYFLRLFVTGATAKSIRALTNIKRICEEHLQGRYVLEVVDVFQQPHLAKQEQIVAAPTLIKCLPSPLRKLIGDLADVERILLALDLKPKPKAKGRT
jgi:circadian clock protein KaiB